MNRLPVFWVGRPDEDEGKTRPYIGFRFRDDWVAVDSDQLLAPVTLTERDGTTVEPTAGLLKQYGGDSLRADMMEEAMSNGLEGLEDTRWLIEYDDALGFVAMYVGGDDTD